MPRLHKVLISAIVFALPSLSFAQERRVVIDKSKIPLEAKDAKDFVPAGWVIEEQITGDLNGDSTPDIALKLIQAKRARGEDSIEERHRALVILRRGYAGKLIRMAVAGKLLQCTACGGAFYGLVEAPADVKIDNGVLIVSQEHGSRNVVEQTFRFRYHPRVRTLMLIGLDTVDRDRATGEVVKESTNFLTGRKTTSRFQASETANQAETQPSGQGGTKSNQAETLNEAQTQPSGQGGSKSNQAETQPSGQGGTKSNQAETLNEAQTEPSGPGGSKSNQAETQPSGQGGTKSNQAETLNQAETQPSGPGGSKSNQAETLNQAETRTIRVPRQSLTIEQVDWEKW